MQSTEANVVKSLEEELAEAKCLMCTVLNGGVDEGLEWTEVLERVRRFIAPEWAVFNQHHKQLREETRHGSRA